MTNDKLRVLLVSNDDSGKELLNDFLTESSGGEILLEPCSNIADMENKIGVDSWDVVLLDQSIPEKQDISQVSHAFEVARGVPVVLLSGTNDKTFADLAISKGAHDSLILGEDNGTTIINSLRHASAHKLIESDLHYSNSLLATIMESPFEAIILIDTENNITRWNQGAQFLFGYKNNEVIGQAIWNLASPNYKSTIAASTISARETSSQDLKENMQVGVGLHKNGNLFPIEYSFNVLNSDIGNQVVCFIRDITSKKTAQYIKRSSEILFGSITEGIMITDLKNTITVVNQGFCEITGYSAEEVIGKTPTFLSSGHHDKEFYNNMWECLKSSGRWQGEIWNRRKNGEIFPASARMITENTRICLILDTRLLFFNFF